MSSGREDRRFEQKYGLAILVETARLWTSLGYHGEDGKFHIDGVTGPDEYSAIVRDNTYTNLAAARNLAAAADAAQRWPKAADELEVTRSEISAWRAAADAIAMPFDAERNVHQQDRGINRPRGVGLRDDAARRRVSAVAERAVLPDLPQAGYQAGRPRARAALVRRLVHAAEKARAFDYYERLTVRDSSLSACTQAIVAAEVGHLDLAADYLAEAAMMDLRDLEHNTRDGLHIASLAGTWLAVVAGFGGMRDYGGRLSFHPQLPPGWTRLSFRLVWHGARVKVEVGPDEVVYSVAEAPDEGIEIWDGNEVLLLKPDTPMTRPVRRTEPATARPSQPAGREPIRADELE